MTTVDPGKLPSQGYMGPQQGYMGPQQGYMGTPPVVQQPSSHHTTVVVQQQQQERRLAPRGWSSGVFDCFNDCGICACVTFCTPCSACQLASDLGEFACLGICVPNWLTAVRASVRAKLNIHGSICDDCCMVTYCGSCVMCQLMREVKLARATGQL